MSRLKTVFYCFSLPREVDLAPCRAHCKCLLKRVELNEIITMIWQQWELQGRYSLCTEDNKRHRELSDCVYLEVFAEQELGPCSLRQDGLPSWAHGTAP